MQSVRLVFACLLLVATATADDALKLIPDSSIVVVRVKTPQQTISDLADFADLVEPGVGAMIRPQLLQVARAFRLGSLAGVDTNKDWYVFGMAQQGGAPQTVCLVPATDAEEVSEQINPLMAVRTFDGYVAIGTEEWPLDAVAETSSATGKSILDQLSQQAIAELNSGHFGVVLNTPAMRLVIAPQLQEAEGAIDQLIDQMAGQLRTANPAMNTAGIETFYRTMFKNGLQATRDNEFLTLSLEVVESDLRFRGLSQFAEASDSATFLKTQPTSGFDGLSMLPAGQSAYAAARLDVSGYFDVIMPMIESAMSGNEQYKQAYEKVVDLMATMEYGDFLLSMDMDMEQAEGALSIASIAYATPMESMKQLMEQFVTLPPLDMNGVKVETSYDPEVATINGKPIGKFVTRQTLSPQLDPTGLQQAVQDRLYGPDGMTQYLLMEDERLIQVVGDGIEGLKALATGQKNESQQFQSARSKLHEQATMIVLADLPQGLKNLAVLTLSIQNLPVPVTAAQISELKIEPTLAGMSAKVVDRGVEVKAHLPAAAIRNVVQAVFSVQQQLKR